MLRRLVALVVASCLACVGTQQHPARSVYVPPDGRACAEACGPKPTFACLSSCPGAVVARDAWCPQQVLGATCVSFLTEVPTSRPPAPVMDVPVPAASSAVPPAASPTAPAPPTAVPPQAPTAQAPLQDEMPHAPGAPVPPGYRVEVRRGNNEHLGYGALAFALSYGVPVLIHLSNTTKASWILVPVVGPLGEAYGFGRRCRSFDCIFAPYVWISMAFLSTLQAGSLIAIGSGLLTTREYAVRVGSLPMHASVSFVGTSAELLVRF